MFPSTLTTFTRPNATDKLNSPSHSSIHTAISSAVGQIEAVIGTDSSTLGTLIGDLRSASSDGGGHVQSAAKGGTGQTTYTKGDVLVAQNASTLGKLAVGNDNQTLVADSSVASGVKWASSPGNRIAVIASVVSLRTASTAETSLVSAIIPGSLLGTTGAIRSRSYVNFQNLQTPSVMATMNYGGGPVASIFLNALANVTSVVGILEGTLMANSDVAKQRATLIFHGAKQRPASGTQGADTSVFTALNTKTSAIEGSADQVFGITLRPIAAGVDFDVEGTIVEKII